MGKPIEFVERETERDNFLTAEEAVEYGLADKIILVSYIAKPAVTEPPGLLI